MYIFSLLFISLSLLFSLLFFRLSVFLSACLCLYLSLVSLTVLSSAPFPSSLFPYLSPFLLSSCSLPLLCSPTLHYSSLLLSSSPFSILLFSLCLPICLQCYESQSRRRVKSRFFCSFSKGINGPPSHIQVAFGEQGYARVKLG